MKGQISIEYTFVYVFVLGVILATITTFSYLKVTSPEEKISESCELGIKVECLDFSVEETGNVVLYVKNIDTTWYEPRLHCVYPNGNNHTGAIAAPKVMKGEKINVTCGPLGSTGLRKGEKDKIKVDLQYHKNITSFKNYREHSGRVVAKVK